MTGPLPQKVDATPLEKDLKVQKAPHQRLAIIDKLVAQYAFTDVKRASILLEEQETLLDAYCIPDFELNFHIFKAIVDNHLYRYESAIFHFQEAIAIVEDRGDVKQQAELYIDYAGTCINVKEMDEAATCLEKADKLLKAFPDQRLEARLICRHGFIHLHYSNYSKGIELLLEAESQITSLVSAITLKDYYFLMLINSGLGNIYQKNDDHEKGIKAYQRVIEMAESTGIISRLSWHYLNIGNGYMALQDLEEAETYFLQAVRTNEDANTYAKASAYANLGYCYLHKRLHQKALELLDKAETLFRSYGPDDLRNLANIATWRAQVLADLGENRAAAYEFRKALNYAEEEEDYKQLSNTYKELAAFYAKRKNYKKAYELQILHSKFSEQYVMQVNERKRWELEAQYEAEQEKQRVELLRLQLAKLQLKALRAQMNPHFLYNALNSIQNYITSNKVTYAAKYLAKFAKLMRQSLDYSDLETISLEKEIEFLRDYLDINEKLRFEDKLSYTIEIDDEIEEDIMGVPTMIVQPYVENAIEHGLRTKKNGLVTLSLSLLDEDTILCVVEDNGIGRAKARELQQQDAQYQNHRSRGTNITEQRLALLHNTPEDSQVFVKTIDLFDDQGAPSGTRVEIIIPVVDIHVK